MTDIENSKDDPAAEVVQSFNAFSTESREILRELRENGKETETFQSENRAKKKILSSENITPPKKIINKLVL